MEFGLLLSFFSLLLALFLDYKFAEPKAWHPLVGFGRYVSWLEAQLNPQSRGRSRQHQQIAGLAAALLAVVPIVGFILMLQLDLPAVINVLVDAALLYLCIGWSSLQQHARAIYDELAVNSLPQAQEKLSWIVSRETDQLNGQQVAQSSVESILENSSDALFASIFWFMVLGAEGAVLHRLVNTLDAMWGYKTQRYLHFGRFAAKFDDLLNYLPARLTAYGFVFCARSIQLGRQGLTCWREQAKLCESPNGGVVMTTGAGALNVTLSEGAYYHGQWKEKPAMGMGSPAGVQSLSHALSLVERTLVFWVAMIGGLAFVI